MMQFSSISFVSDIFSRNLSGEKEGLHPIFLKTLKELGWPKELVDLLIRVSQVDEVASLETLYCQLGESSIPRKNEYRELIRVYQKEIDSNIFCYLRDKPEKTRVTQWPNVQSTRKQQPDHYFDIFEDVFVRQPARFIDKDSAIVSAGSCFAQRIAHQLQLNGYNYLIEEDDLPVGMEVEDISKTSYRASSVRAGVLFSVPALRQMVERAAGKWQPDYLLYTHKGKLFDPFRRIKPLYSDEEGFVQDYRVHSEALSRALLKCDVLIITLGLCEAWRFIHSKDYITGSPQGIHPALLEKKFLTVDENIQELDRLYHVFHEYNPTAKLIVTVSPVPLNTTYSSEDHVVVANSIAKSRLRVAADEFCKKYPGAVYYFPSYEVVLYGSKAPWEADMRHVSAAAIKRVMETFKYMFLKDQSVMKYIGHKDELPSELTRLDYLKNILINRPKRFIRQWILKR